MQKVSSKFFFVWFFVIYQSRATIYFTRHSFQALLDFNDKKRFPINISKVGPTLTQSQVALMLRSSKSIVTMKRVRRTIQKLVVLFVILVSIGLFFRQAIICIDRFVSKETQINLDILRLESLSSFFNDSNLSF